MPETSGPRPGRRQQPGPRPGPRPSAGGRRPAAVRGGASSARRSPPCSCASRPRNNQPPPGTPRARRAHPRTGDPRPARTTPSPRLRPWGFIEPRGGPASADHGRGVPGHVHRPAARSSPGPRAGHGQGCHARSSAPACRRPSPGPVQPGAARDLPVRPPRRRWARSACSTSARPRRGRRPGHAAGHAGLHRPAQGADGPSRALGQGTGLEEAATKGHYLILIWASSSTAPRPSQPPSRLSSRPS